MPVNLRAKVIGIGVDNDPFTGRGYTLVQLGIESDIPPPPQVQNQYPPVVRTTLYKHVLHVFVPSEQWRNQYNMWSEYEMIIEDDGQLRLNHIAENN